MTNFEHVAGPLAGALNKREYTKLTPVQDAVLAPELVDADLLVSAQTGSGKTVAFGLALAPNLLAGNERFERAKTPLALVIAPTRELALQVKRELEWLYGQTGAAIFSCVGGMDMRTERRDLSRGCHIVVGTPGRLRDHIERNSLDLSNIKAVVLDEADEMLDLGFRDDLEFILQAAPESRRTLMFSATVPRSIANLAKRYQRNSVRLQTTSDKEQHHDIQYRAFTVAANDRENAIINVLRYYEAESAIVFCNTRATVNHMTARFTNRGFSVVALSGELSQGQRTHALQAMRDGRARVCIATDVAARGIDLPNLELVIHADLPKNRESLLHRSGRTGRAGRKGVSALIVPYNARRRTERLFDSANIKADWAKPPSVDDVLARDNQRILENPALSAPIEPDEENFVQELTNQFSSEQLAAAFARLYRASHSAPEELRDAPDSKEPRERKTARRADFTDGVWFSISVGRKQNAEPRWLLPMICRAGGITKTEIGAIKIDHNESNFELSPECVDGFLQHIGPDRTVEKNVTITRLDKRPQMPDRQPRARPKKPYSEKPFEKRKKKPKSDYTPQADSAPADRGFDPNPIEKPVRRGKKKRNAPAGLKGPDGVTPQKSKLSPAQKKRKQQKKKMRKQSK